MTAAHPCGSVHKGMRPALVFIAIITVIAMAAPIGNGGGVSSAGTLRAYLRFCRVHCLKVSRISPD
jgi:hypothetical protein